MLDTEEVLRIVNHHSAWWDSDKKLQAERHRDAYSDQFWGSETELRRVWRTDRGRLEGDESGNRRMNTTEINLVRPWVISFVASLYYRGVRFTVEADELHKDETAEERQKKTQGVRLLLNRFFAKANVEDAAERLFTMGLLYPGGCAFKLGRIPPDKRLKNQRSTDLVFIEAMPPYECVWDRRSRSRESCRYWGRILTMSREEVAFLFDKKVEADDEIPDVVDDGFKVRDRDPKDHNDKSYVRILELYDMTATYKAESGDEAVGTCCWYRVEQDGEDSPRVTLLKKAPCPYDWPDGSPMLDIVPFIPEPAIEYPLDSYAPVASVYELNSELNRAISVVSEAFRRDAARIVLYLKDKGVDEEVLDAIKNGEDLEFVGIDAETLAGLFEHLDLPPISSTLLEYIRQLQEGIDRTQLLADFTRGKAGEYLSATEVANLVNYSETTIGRIRKRMDAAIADAAARYLRILRHSMDATGETSIKVHYQDDAIEIKAADLDRRWKIQVVDTASTPAATAQKQTEFLMVMPQLLEMATLMDPAGGAAAAMARQSIDFLVELMDLPAGFRTEVLLSAPPPVPPEETSLAEGEPAQGAQGAPLTPEEEEELMLQAPEAQALMAAAEQGM